MHNQHKNVKTSNSHSAYLAKVLSTYRLNQFIKKEGAVNKAKKSPKQKCCSKSSFPIEVGNICCIPLLKSKNYYKDVH